MRHRVEAVGQEEHAPEQLLDHLVGRRLEVLAVVSVQLCSVLEFEDAANGDCLGLFRRQGRRGLVFLLFSRPPGLVISSAVEFFVVLVFIDQPLFQLLWFFFGHAV